jgi:predicted ArsR family transcriptional regulator
VPRPTSEDAADTQGKTKRAIDRITILRALAWQSEGLTRDEIAANTGISPNTVRPRIVELVTLGLVSDERIKRLTETGSPAAVCEITDKGRTVLKGTP